MPLSRIEEVLYFWFQELTPAQWFARSDELDQFISKKFLSCLKTCAKGEMFPWRQTPEGRLAEIIVLDQFSRNIYRGTPQAFANDGMALVLAQEMVAQQLDQKLTISERAFAYMPYMHSESTLIHQEAMKLFSVPGLEENLKYEIEHKDIIDRFGRYPHRNAILGRTSTAEELIFLKGHTGF